MAYDDITIERNGQLENHLSIPGRGKDFSRRMHNGSGFIILFDITDLPLRDRLETYNWPLLAASVWDMVSSKAEETHLFILTL